jgi:hypothetical protein
MFSSLISRCTIPLSWRYRRPLAVCRPSGRARAGGRPWIASPSASASGSRIDREWGETNVGNIADAADADCGSGNGDSIDIDIEDEDADRCEFEFEFEWARSKLANEPAGHGSVVNHACVLVTVAENSGRMCS